MKVTNPKTQGAVMLPTLGLVVGAGETIDVDDAVGASLIEQGWSTPAAPKKAAPSGADKKES